MMIDRELLIATLKHQEKIHRKSGANGLANLFRNSELCITEQNEKLRMLSKECEAYKEVLRYCKHNKTGQGAKINGVFWLYSED
tara:strand:+ start:231 stop:482 length:252 start_codon:yes stop_codon:yes gene_type:complete